MSELSEIALLSLKVAGVGVVFAMPLAFVIAYILARWRFPGRILLSALVMMPLVMPPVVSGLVLLELFGPRGVIGAWLGNFGIQFGFRWTGAALAAGFVALPLMVRPMRLALESVDYKLHEALAVAGLGPWRRLLVLDLPMALPGIIAGLVLGFAKGLGEFGATITFVASIPGETRTLSLAIYSALQSAQSGQLVFILSAVSIGISILAILASEIMVENIGRKLGRGRVNIA